VLERSIETPTGLIGIEAIIEAELIVPGPAEVNTAVHQDKVGSTVIAGNGLANLVGQISRPERLLQDGQPVKDHDGRSTENRASGIRLAADHAKPCERMLVDERHGQRLFRGRGRIPRLDEKGLSAINLDQPIVLLDGKVKRRANRWANRDPTFDLFHCLSLGGAGEIGIDSICTGVGAHTAAGQVEEISR